MRWHKIPHFYMLSYKFPQLFGKFYVANKGDTDLKAFSLVDKMVIFSLLVQMKFLECFRSTSIEKLR